jgi:hypothetical protein
MLVLSLGPSPVAHLYAAFFGLGLRPATVRQALLPNHAHRVPVNALRPILKAMKGSKNTEVKCRLATEKHMQIIGDLNVFF